MTINEMMKEFTESTNHDRKIELYELIKTEQRKQEQAMIAVLYPKENNK